VLVGGDHSGTAETAISVTGADAVAIHGHASTGRGVLGTGGTGVWGETSSESGLGVYARNTNTGGGAMGLYAHSPNGIGIEGHTLTGVGVAGAGGTGVAGEGGAVGVSGHSSGGTGVKGAGMIGVHAQGSIGGVALKVTGRAVLDLSGRLTIGSGKDRVNSSMGLPIHAGSIVVAVVQSGDGKAWVRKVVPHNGYFTVILNKLVSTSTKVAWIAIG
jgi:hypothetical protein